MPPVVRRYIKTAFVFLLLGLLTGAIMSIDQGLLGRPVPLFLIAAHTHALLVGFMFMMIVGVATWMFPRLARGDTRYRPGVAEAVYWILMLSTALRFAGEVTAAYRPFPGLWPIITAGRLGQVLGGILFVANIWPRVRSASTFPKT